MTNKPMSMISKRAAQTGALTALEMEGNPDPSRDVWLTESRGRGYGALLGRITPAGERRWYYRYKGSAAQVRLPIGPYSRNGDGERSFTVAQARKEAKALDGLRERGVKDLREHFAALKQAENEAAALELQRLERERRAAAAQAEAERLAAERRITVRQLFDRWADTDLKPQTKADGSRSGREDGGASIKAHLERRVFPTLGHLAVADVKKADVLAILDKAKSNGRMRTANVVLAALRQMFGFALDRELIEVDPTARLGKKHAGGKEVLRDRVLAAADIKTLTTALPLAGMGKRAELAVWAILATACRIGELMAARWEHIDLEGKRWYLPETKNGRDHTIHLSAFALQQFKALQGIRGKQRDEDGKETGEPVSWVFPNLKRTGRLDAKTITKQLMDRQQAGSKPMKGRTKTMTALALPGGKWTAHDLRRTAATFMAELGISGDTIDECLNHTLESRVRRTYIRDRRLPEQARAFDALGRRLEALTGGEATESNVVPMAAAA